MHFLTISFVWWYFLLSLLKIEVFCCSFLSFMQFVLVCTRIIICFWLVPWSFLLLKLGFRLTLIPTNFSLVFHSPWSFEGHFLQVFSRTLWFVGFIAWLRCYEVWMIMVEWFSLCFLGFLAQIWILCFHICYGANEFWWY